MSETPAGDAATRGEGATTIIHQYLTFELAGESYGIEIPRVEGIQGWDRVTPIPNTPDYVLGVINLRGEIVPIVDLRRRFHLGEAEFGRTTVVIIVRVRGSERDRTVGLVVDAVCDVSDLGEGEIKPPPEIGSGIDTEFVRGLASIDERMVILLDVDRLISRGVLGEAGEGESLH